MKRKSLWIIVVCTLAGPPLAFAALFFAGKSSIPGLLDFVIDVLALPWFWVHTQNEMLFWLLLIVGSGLLYGFLIGLICVELLKRTT